MQKKNFLRFPKLISVGFAFILLLVFGLSPVSAQQGQNARDTKVTLKVENMNLDKVLDTLSKVARVQFFYNHSQINVNKKVTFNHRDQTLDYILIRILGDQPVSVEYQTNRVVVLKAQPRVAQEAVIYKIRGRVIDAHTREPLPGASILLRENKALGVASDANGGFFIEVPQGTSALLVSFMGYEEESVAVTGDAENIEIRLTQSQTKIDDVVVTGMAPRKVDSFTGTYVTVKGEELARLNPNNLLQALQFFDPGFRVVENNQRGSDPNAMPEFRLRGDEQLGSVASSDMQMLMGDYSNRPNMPLFILDGFEASLQRIVDLNPERVESITILKDASATAIYGSRAANGVIVFETKSPLPGVINVAYSMNTGISVPDLSGYNLMNAAEKLEYERRAGLFPESNVPQLNYYNHYREEILRGVDTYWLSAPLRTAVTHRHTLSMQGGDNALRYNLSANYGSQPGVIKQSDRSSMGLSFDLQYRRKQWNISNNISLSDVKGNNSSYGSFSDYSRMNQYYRKYDENGRYTKFIEDKSMGAGNQRQRIFNPLYNTQFPYKDYTRNFDVTDNLSIEYSIRENLRISASASFTKGTARSEKFKSKNHTDFEDTDDPTKKGSYDKSLGETFAWNANASINYNFVSGAHLLSTFARWNIDESQNSITSLSATGFPNDNMTDFLFAYEMSQNINGTEYTRRAMGIIGQVSYMYDYRYAADFSIRGDISSQFGANTGMAPFWTAGVRWNANREKWMEESVFSSLVLRGSYGITGSQNYSPYQALETYTFNNLMFPYRSSDVIGAELMGLGNPDLRWSKTKERSVSLEFGLWKDRITGSVSYYNSHTDELLLDYTLAPSVGFRTFTMNAGALENKGADIQLSVIPYVDYERRIQWVVSANAAHNKNKIKKISNVLKKMNEANLAKTGAPLPIYEEGKSTSQLFTVISLGIDPATGQEVYLKRNGMRTFVWDPADKVAVGDTQAKWTGSVYSSLNYRNLSLMFAFTYNLGAYQYNSTLVDKLENTSIAYNMDRRALTGRWSEENRHARYKSIAILGSDTPQSSRFVQKLNEFRFSSISAGYRFDPKDNPWMEKARIGSLSLNFSMQDIARMSTVKQERGLEYPFMRSFNLSLSLLFN